MSVPSTPAAVGDPDLRAAAIGRSVDADDRELFARWPDQALDRARVHTVFERFGLPDRVD